MTMQMHVRDTHRFFDVVNSSNGTIEMLMSNGKSAGLKGNEPLQYVLEDIAPQNGVVDITVSAKDASDVNKLIQFMMND